MRTLLLSLICLAPIPSPPDTPTKELFIGSWEKKYYDQLNKQYISGRIEFKESGIYSYRLGENSSYITNGKWYISSRNELVITQDYVSTKATWVYKISFEKWPTISCNGEYDWPKTPEMLLWRE